jgi:hypothetical protein
MGSPRLPARLLRLEEVSGPEPDPAGHQVGGKRLDAPVELGDDGVVVVPDGGDAVVGGPEGESAGVDASITPLGCNG